MIGGRRRGVEGGVMLEFDSVGSTMDVAKECVRTGQTDVIAVRAGFQECGRGRHGRSWSAPPNTCLLVTYIFPETAWNLRRFALATPVAVAAAIESVCGLSPSIKWPNDLLVNRRKLAGILIENFWTGQRSSGGTMLVGIGLNANIAEFPSELADIATSVLIETGQLVSIEALEPEVRMQLHSWLSRDWQQILTAWRRRDVTEGMRYTAAVGLEEITGIAIGISDSGALLLRTDKGPLVEVVSATAS